MHGVSVVEANVMELIECSFTKRIIRVHAIWKDRAAADRAKWSFFADLVIIANGC
jgi:hypothetical protein